MSDIEINLIFILKIYKIIQTDNDDESIAKNFTPYIIIILNICYLF